MKYRVLTAAALCAAELIAARPAEAREKKPAAEILRRTEEMIAGRAKARHSTGYVRAIYEGAIAMEFDENAQFFYRICYPLRNAVPEAKPSRAVCRAFGKWQNLNTPPANESGEAGPG